MNSRPTHHRALVLILLPLAWSLGSLQAGERNEAVAPAVPAAGASANKPDADMAAEAKGLLALGASLTDRNDYAAAEIAYRQILNSAEFARADQKDALLGLARTYRKQGSLTKAAAIYQKFIKEFADDARVPDALLDLGRTLRSMGANKMAINSFYSVMNSTLKLPAEGFEHYELLAKTAQFEIAETYFASGNYVEAGKFFSRLKLLDLAPADRARAHFKSACARQLAGDLEGAVTTLRTYLEQWPLDENGPEARYLLATTLRQLNRPDEAMAATLELLKHEQAHSEAEPKRWSYWQRRTGNQLANDFFQGGDTINALAIYQGLAVLDPDPSWQLPITYQIALCYERLRLVDRARASYQKIIDTLAAAKAPGPDLAELNRMAGWRLAHLDWSDQTEHQLSAFFSTTTGSQSKPAPSPASHEPNGSPAEPPTIVR